MILEGIDTTTTEGKIKVMQAHAEGRRIATCSKQEYTWTEAERPTWNWGTHNYAVVKEPRTLWVVEVKHAVSGMLHTVYYCSTEQEAEGYKREWKYNSGGNFNVTITKFVEA